MKTQQELADILKDLVEQQHADKGIGARKRGEFTTREIRELLGCGNTRANNVAKRMVTAGLAERCMVQSVDAWGITRPQPGYRLTKEGKRDER